MSAPQRRGQILEVATRMIAERGYWGTSLREVGDACGITVAGVLHHFPSKQALLVAVLERRDRLDEQAITEKLGLDAVAGGGAKVSMARVCREIVARNAGQRELVHLGSVLAAESLDAGHPAHEHFRERQTWVLESLAELAPAGSDAHAVARRVLALLEGLQLQWLRDPSRNWVEDWERVAVGVPELSDDT
jgi:AcrR family transcriptional regulator